MKSAPSPSRSQSASPAVVLLSGGLDSTTVLAIAQSEGFAVHALTFAYGQRHSAEIDAAKAIAKSAGVARHHVVEIDLTLFGGSALTADIPVPKDRDLAPSSPSAKEIPVTYVPARNTIFLSYALALAEVVGASNIFIGVNALDYSGYPDCRPEYIQAFEKMANLATRAGVEGRTRLVIRTPLISLSKAAIIKLGTSLGVDYSQTTSCYDPGPERRSVRPMRCVSAPTQGLQRGGTRGSDRVRVARRPRSGRERVDLHREGDFLHAAGRGRADRARGGVLPLLRLQPLVGAGGGPVARGLPVLRHRFRRHRTGRRQIQERQRACGRDRSMLGSEGRRAQRARLPKKYVVCTGGEPLLQVDENLISELHQRGFEVAVETNGTSPRRITRLDLRQSQGGRAARADDRQRAEARLPSGQCAAGKSSSSSTSATFFSSRWMDPTRRNTERAIEYCLRHPRWRLSIQTHKLVGLR